jgi:hypothetical protein
MTDGRKPGTFQIWEQFYTQQATRSVLFSILKVPNSIAKRATIITNKNVNKTCHYNK